jgi:hypothetical protein
VVVLLDGPLDRAWLLHLAPCTRRSLYCASAGSVGPKAVVLPLCWRGLEMASRHGLVAGEKSQEIYGRALVGNFDALSPFM